MFKLIAGLIHDIVGQSVTLVVKFQTIFMLTNLAILGRKHSVVCKSNEFEALSHDFHHENMDIFP